MSASADPITSLVVLIFSSQEAALLMAGAILLAAVGLIGYSGFFEFQPLTTSLIKRAEALRALGGRGLSAQKAFLQRFAEIDRTMGSTLTAPPVLVLGWSRWRSLLVADDEGRLVTSALPEDAFEALDGPARSLEWWANIFVAVGLVVTFLGIVAALTEAVATMKAGSSGGMQAALLGLLEIAATKFWTSVAGVLSSILLRLVARRRRSRITALEADFFATLENLVVFAPPERVAQEQLTILRRLESSLIRVMAQCPEAGVGRTEP
jgi:hypothetical protein